MVASVLALDLHGNVLPPDQASRYSGAVSGGIKAAALSGFGRHDTEGAVVLDAEEFSVYREDANAGVFEDALRRFRIKRDTRYDTLTSQAAGVARQFEFIHAQILEEPKKPLNLERLVLYDRSVPQGPKTHTWQRESTTGEARKFRGGHPVPVVNSAIGEKEFGIIHLVCSVRVNFFEALSTDWANMRKFQRDTRTAIRVLREATNRIGFDGDIDAQVFGIKTHPLLPKPTALVSFTPASIAADPVGTRVELNRLANYARQVSGGTFRPDRFATSLRIRDALMQTEFSTASPRSVGRAFLDGQEDIDAIIGIQEFREFGPNGEDGMFFYDSAFESTHFVEVQPPTPLPMHQLSSLDSEVVYYTTIGGCVMPNVGANVLAYGQAG